LIINSSNNPQKTATVPTIKQMLVIASFFAISRIKNSSTIKVVRETMISKPTPRNIQLYPHKLNNFFIVLISRSLRGFKINANVGYRIPPDNPRQIIKNAREYESLLVASEVVMVLMRLLACTKIVFMESARSFITPILSKKVIDARLKPPNSSNNAIRSIPSIQLYYKKGALNRAAIMKL